jgi:hypothetical protein
MEVKEFEGLKLGQKILVDSSCYVHGEFIKLCTTRLVDAFESRGYSKPQIKMAKDHNNWGACPTRSRNMVIANEDDIKKFFEMKFKNQKKKVDELKEKYPDSKYRTLEEKLEDGEVIFKVGFNRGAGWIQVTPFFKSGTVNSLAQGKYDTYTGQEYSGKIRIYDKQKIFY